LCGLNPSGSQYACSDLLCCERDVAEDSAGIADRLASLALIAVYFGVITMTLNQAASADRDPDRRPPVFYRSITVDGLSLFYREAGRPEAPTLLLLHGFPSSSRMYEPLLTRLSGQFHLVAPDYPGFGHSDAPGAKDFTYTFDHLADVMEHFTEALGLKGYALYLQDYGGPVGFRLAPNALRPLSSRMRLRTRATASGCGRTTRRRPQ
jgi:hypothetical protein